MSELLAHLQSLSKAGPPTANITNVLRNCNTELKQLMANVPAYYSAEGFAAFGSEQAKELVLVEINLR